MSWLSIRCLRGWTPSGPIATNLGTLPVGSVTSFLLSAVVDASMLGVITNQADVSAATFDPNVSNNTDHCTTLVDGEADLAIFKTCPATTPEGAPISYMLLVTNAGPSDARGVNVLDLLPAGVTPGGPFGVGVGTLPVGGGTTIVINATVDAGTAGMTLVNQADVSAITVDSNMGNNTDNCGTLIQRGFKVTNTIPANAAVNVAAMGVIRVEFSDDADLGTVNSNSFAVRGEQFGLYPGTYALGESDTVEFTPTVPFLFGESIEVTLSRAIHNTSRPGGTCRLQLRVWDGSAGMSGGVPLRQPDLK